MSTGAGTALCSPLRTAAPWLTGIKAWLKRCCHPTLAGGAIQRHAATAPGCLHALAILALVATLIASLVVVVPVVVIVATLQMRHVAPSCH